MANVTLATVDAAAAESIKEALEDADIPVELVSVRPFKQLEYLRHQQRALVDINVDQDRVIEGKAALARYMAEAEIAVMEQAGGGTDALADGAESSGVSDEKSESPEIAEGVVESRKLDPPRSRTKGLLISVFIPVAGPIYAGSSRLTQLSVLAHLFAFVAFIARGEAMSGPVGDTSLFLSFLLFSVARLVDVVGTQLVIVDHNAKLDASEKDHAPRP